MENPMKIRKYFAAALLLILTSFTFAQEAQIDEPAPNFTLTDSKGETHSLSDFEGKYVVLEWINFDCPFVEKHYNSSNMQNLQKKYTEKDIVWLAICSSAPGKQGHFDSEEINERIEDLGGAMTAYLIDEDGIVGKAYGAKTTPHMYIVNPDGNLIYAGGIDNIPSADEDDIPEATNYVSVALDAAMSGKEVVTKTSKPYGCSVKY
jgi:peroxiredoxin